MRRFGFILGVIALSFCASCTREPIYDAVSKYRFEFELDSDVLYCKDASPELIEVLFYDPASGKKVTEAYMSPTGGYLYSVEPGMYDIVAFSMGAKSTDITYTKDLNLLTAETKVLQSSPEKVIVSPDHVYACVKRGVVIPSLSEADPEFSLEFPLESVCDSWKVEVRGIKGLRYASSAYLYVSGQTADILLKDMKKEGTCSVRAKSQAVRDTTCLEIPFCTFGMTGSGTITAKLIIEAQNGQKHTGEFDITSQVRDSCNATHLITIDFPAELKPPVQGGLDPSSDPWNENREHIDIQ